MDVKLFLVLLEGEFFLLDTSPRETIYKKAELVRTFNKFSGAIAFAKKTNITFQEVFAGKVKRPHSTETRHKMRLKKLGSFNPNAKGLSETHKRRIGNKIRGLYVGANNINHGRPRTRLDRMKISQGKYLEARRVKRRWALSPWGKEHLVPYYMILPQGWVFGRKRSVIKKKPYKRASS